MAALNARKSTPSEHPMADGHVVLGRPPEQDGLGATPFELELTEESRRAQGYYHDLCDAARKEMDTNPDGVECWKLIRILGQRCGVKNIKTSSFSAIRAVLARNALWHAKDKEAWTFWGASRGCFEKWRNDIAKVLQAESAPAKSEATAVELSTMKLAAEGMEGAHAHDLEVMADAVADISKTEEAPLLQATPKSCLRKDRGQGSNGKEVHWGGLPAAPPSRAAGYIPPQRLRVSERLAPPETARQATSQVDESLIYGVSRRSGLSGEEAVQRAQEQALLVASEKEVAVAASAQEAREEEELREAIELSKTCAPPPPEDDGEEARQLAEALYQSELEQCRQEIREQRAQAAWTDRHNLHAEVIQEAKRRHAVKTSKAVESAPVQTTPVPRREVHEALARMDSGAATEGDRVTLSQSISRGVATGEERDTDEDALGHQVVKSEHAHVEAPEVWRPRQNSVAARAAAAAVRMDTGARELKAPQRFAESTSLAQGMGHYLSAPEQRLQYKPPCPPPAPPTVQEQAILRAERPINLCMPTYEGPLFANEFRLPLDASFEWPHITRFAFYEDKGCLRESWRARGYISCSVADRPTQIEPSDGCYHFIAQVYDFVAVFPYPIDVQTSHVECGPASWSSWKSWAQKLLDGRMREAGEEVVWIASIGNRAGAEQPHTAHESTIGVPTQVINANEHGGADKTWCLWLRNIGSIAPTVLVPEAERHEVLSKARGNKEEVMLARSRTSRQMADALTAAIDAYKDAPVEERDRPAAQPCKQYQSWRAAFHHNLGILNAMFAPVLSREVLLDPERTHVCILLLPLAPSLAGPRFLVPLQKGEIFGVVAAPDASLKEQAEQAGKHLTVGIPTHHMHSMGNATGDVIVAVPWDRSPVTCVNTAEEMKQAAASGAPAVWCASSALIGSTAYEPALRAAMRCEAMGGPATSLDANTGIWARAKPAVRRQHAMKYGAQQPTPEATQEWESLLQRERERKVIMQRDLEAADQGSGLTQGITADVRTAADFLDELPMPAQGLPQIEAADCMHIPSPERPLPLDRDWLHVLPPQAVPPGFTPLRIQQVLRGWCLRMSLNIMNRNMAYDAHCFIHGEAPAHLRRPASATFGRGAAKEISHQDGRGTYNAFDVLLERQPSGLMDAMDFTDPKKRKWVFEVIEKYLGTTKNKEIMSFLFHGVCWKVNLRGQLHVSKNLTRFDTRAKEIAITIMKLAKSDYIDIVPLCNVEEGLNEESTSPFLYTPQNNVPIGGLTKDDGSARVVGDMSDPHPGQRVRNAPDGEPDGPPAMSVNEMSGPKGGPKEGYTGPLPFPEPEPKPRPRHKYKAATYLTVYAELNDTFLVTMDDDMRHMFFQFFIRRSDLYLCVWYTVMEIDGAVMFVAVRARTMNQGARNASKIACNFAEEWLEAWRLQMDEVVRGWIPLQKPAMIEAYEQRKSHLGEAQARPFWAAVYTDNFDFTFSASELAAVGTFLWRRMNKEANIWLQDHVIYGTCTTWIGGRYVLSAGFGCLTPSKKSRALAQCKKALAGTLTREEYESNNSFLVHVNDICDWPTGALQGLTGPLKVPGFDDDRVIMTPQAAERYQNAIVLLETHSFASFMSGIEDAYYRWSGKGAALVRIHTHATDCCTDPEPHEFNCNPRPHVAGFCEGYFWRFPLEGEWLKKHITLTEATGPALSVLQTVPLFPDEINLLASDATAALAAGTGSSKSADTQLMQRELEKTESYNLHRETLWYDHWKGWGNGISDELSRDNLEMASRLAHAFGIKLTEIPMTAESRAFMAATLRATSDEAKARDEIHVEVRGLDGHHRIVSIAGDGTADDLLEQYCAKLLPLSRAAMSLRVVMQGKQLEGHLALRDAGWLPGLTAHVLPRARAGGLEGLEDSPSPLQGPAPARETMREQPARAPPTRAKSPSRTPGCMAAGSSTAHGALRSLSPSPQVEALGVPHEMASRRSPRIERAALQAVPEVTFATQREVGSPQPGTAPLARAQAVSKVAHRLAANTSSFAICPDDPARLHRMVLTAGHVKLEAIPKGSKAADAWGFKWVMAFAKDMGSTVRWMRPRLDDPELDIEQEVWFTCLALMWISHNMSPSARRQKRGYDEAQPTSAMLAIYGWMRVQLDCGRYTCDTKAMRPVLLGLCMRYKAMWGQEAFTVEQAKLFTRAMLLAIVIACDEYKVPNWSRALHDAWGVQIRYMISTGERKDVFCRDFQGEDVLQRANITVVDQLFEPTPTTPASLAAVKNGHLVRATSAASKCDRLNVDWSKQKQWFRHDDADPLNFAAAWVRYELKYPCAMETRRSWPAFSPAGDETCFTSSQFVSQHKQLLVHSIGAEDAEGRTPHSHRASFISALAAARATGKHPELTDAVCQVHLRWKNVDSMLSYMKMQPHAFANNVRVGTDADPGLHGREDTPEVEPVGALREISHMVAMLGIKQSKGAPPKGDEQPRQGKECAKRAMPDSAVPQEATASLVEDIEVVGNDKAVCTKGQDSWHLLGTTHAIPNGLWINDCMECTRTTKCDTCVETTRCMVSHYLGTYAFLGGGKRQAYTITPEDEPDVNYAVRADYLLSRLAPAQRAALSKVTLRGEKRRPPPSPPPSPPSSRPPSPPPSPPYDDDLPGHPSYCCWAAWDFCPVCDQLICTACNNVELFEVVHNLGRVERIVGDVHGIWRNLYAVRDVAPALPDIHDRCVCGCHNEYFNVSTRSTTGDDDGNDEEESEPEDENIPGPLTLLNPAEDPPAGFVAAATPVA